MLGQTHLPCSFFFSPLLCACAIWVIYLKRALCPVFRWGHQLSFFTLAGRWFIPKGCRWFVVFIEWHVRCTCFGHTMRCGRSLLCMSSVSLSICLLIGCLSLGVPAFLTWPLWYFRVVCWSFCFLRCPTSLEAASVVWSSHILSPMR